LLSDDADEFATERDLDPAGLVDLYARRIADTDAARQALTVIVEAANDAGDDEVSAESLTLAPEVDEAYQVLFTEAGLQSAGVSAAPGSDQESFVPLETAKEWTVAVNAESGSAVAGEPGLLGDGILAKLREAILGPARQLSFWSMKHRARAVGECGPHQLLVRMQQSAPSLRIHLMGHSFGCILVSAAVAGPTSGGTLANRLTRPVTSLFLVQGAMSLWSFANAIPFPPSEPGYFRPVFASDRAVGIFFPIGAKLGQERLLDENNYPEYGGIGTYGAQGYTPTVAHEILNSDAEYGLDPGTTYNIDASRIIAQGGGASGAHSDIAHPEVAHLFWQAALAGILAARD
jgi:hypothetical protein